MRVSMMITCFAVLFAFNFTTTEAKAAKTALLHGMGEYNGKHGGGDKQKYKYWDEGRSYATLKLNDQPVQSCRRINVTREGVEVPWGTGGGQIECVDRFTNV